VHPALTFQVQPLRASAASCYQTSNESKERIRENPTKCWENPRIPRYSEIPENPLRTAHRTTLTRRTPRTPQTP
jgi:hypothetical protein